MEDERLVYQSSVNGSKRQVIDFYTEVGLEINTDMLDYHGQECTCCGKQFRVTRGVVDGAKMVDGITDTQVKKAYIFPVCNKCAKPIRSDEARKKVERLREKIYGALGIVEEVVEAEVIEDERGAEVTVETDRVADLVAEAIVEDDR